MSSTPHKLPVLSENTPHTPYHTPKHAPSATPPPPSSPAPSPSTSNPTNSSTRVQEQNENVPFGAQPSRSPSHAPDGEENEIDNGNNGNGNQRFDREVFSLSPTLDNGHYGASGGRGYSLLDSSLDDSFVDAPDSSPIHHHQHYADDDIEDEKETLTLTMTYDDDDLLDGSADSSLMTSTEDGTDERGDGGDGGDRVDDGGDGCGTDVDSLILFTGSSGLEESVLEASGLLGTVFSTPEGHVDPNQESGFSVGSPNLRDGLSMRVPRFSLEEVESLSHWAQVAYMEMHEAVLEAAASELALDSLALRGGTRSAVERMVREVEARAESARGLIDTFYEVLEAEERESGLGARVAAAGEETFRSVVDSAPRTPEMHASGRIPVGLRAHSAYRPDALVTDDYTMLQAAEQELGCGRAIMREDESGVDVFVQHFSGMDEASWSSLIRHLSALQGLDHPCVARLVAFYAAGPGGSSGWHVVTPRVEHASLTSWLGELGASGASARSQHVAKLSLLRNLASGIYAVHSAGIAGLALTTPGSVMVSADARPILSYFGSATSPVWGPAGESPGDSKMARVVRDLRDLGALTVMLFAELTGGGPLVELDGQTVWNSRRVAETAPLLASFLAFLLQPADQLAASLGGGRGGGGKDTSSVESALLLSHPVFISPVADSVGSSGGLVPDREAKLVALFEKSRSVRSKAAKSKVGKIIIRRAFLVRDTLNVFNKVLALDRPDWCFRLSVAFDGETGVDAGGLSVDMYTHFFRALVSTPFPFPSKSRPVEDESDYEPDAMDGYVKFRGPLFARAGGEGSNHHLPIGLPLGSASVQAAADSLDLIQAFHTMGVVLGKCFLDGYLIEDVFAKPLFTYILASKSGDRSGKEGSCCCMAEKTEATTRVVELARETTASLAFGLEDLASYDPAKASALGALLNVQAPEELFLSFLDVDGGEGTVSRELAPAYVSAAVVHDLLGRGRAESMEAIACGFYDVITPLLGDEMALLTPLTFHNLLCGASEVDVESLIGKLEFVGYPEPGMADEMEALLTDLLRKWSLESPDYVRSFLEFVTSAPRIPEGSVRVQYVAVDGLLPVAHTCAAVLDLGMLGRGELEERLLTAFEFGLGSEFGLA